MKGLNNQIHFPIICGSYKMQIELWTCIAKSTSSQYIIDYLESLKSMTQANRTCSNAQRAFT